MITRAWRGDWYERLKERVRSYGFETVTELADTQPTASLVTLTGQLADDRDIAALQIEKLLIDEAEAMGTMERCARSLLARRIHEELPEGWHREWDDDANFRRAHAYGSWCAHIPSRYDQSLDRIGEVIKTASWPEGWLPAGPDDPILVEFFRQYWREPEQEASPRD